VIKNTLLAVLAILFLLLVAGCGQRDTVENKESRDVDRQQAIYLDTQPIHIYDYSIPRDIYQQIYDITTTEVVATYSVTESITGELRFQCPSIGYAIPADRSLTNPLKGTSNVRQAGAEEFTVVVEQPEPDGLYSSKNTDATWILCVDTETGQAWPMYTEHKVLTWPFIVRREESGEWVRVDRSPINFTVEIRKTSEEESSPQNNSPPTVP